MCHTLEVGDWTENKYDSVPFGSDEPNVQPAQRHNYKLSDINSITAVPN